jgi:hypothetical protein
MRQHPLSFPSALYDLYLGCSSGKHEGEWPVVYLCAWVDDSNVRERHA